MQGVGETALAEAAAGAAQVVPAYSWTGYFMGLALMFVMLAMLWFGARLLRQKGGLRLLGQSAGLNVESRLALGARKHLLVVRYRDKRLLLGVTEHNISLLSEDRLEEDAPLNAVGSAVAHGADGAGAEGFAAGASDTRRPRTENFKDMLHDVNKSE